MAGTGGRAAAGYALRERKGIEMEILSMRAEWLCTLSKGFLPN